MSPFDSPMNTPSENTPSTARSNSDALFPPMAWTHLDSVLLAAVMAIAAFFAARTMGFMFEADDLRYLWWSHERINSPWSALFDPPLFGTYYRPVNLWIWWLHYRLFGMDEPLHNAAFALWWLCLFGLAFLWLRRIGGAVAGLLGCLFFLSMDPSWLLLLWKSWITSIGSMVFHLAALIVLRSAVERFTKPKAFAFVLMALLACFCKESARYSLPLTSIGLILNSPVISREKKIGAISTIAAMGAILFASSKTLRIIAKQLLFYTHEYIVNILSLGHYSLSILNDHIVFLLCLVLPAILLFSQRGKRLWFASAWTALCAIVYIVFRNTNMPSLDASALAAVIYIHGLWFSPYRRTLAVPLIWFMISFWPLPILRLNLSGYPACSAYTLSLVLGASAFFAIEKIRDIIRLAGFQFDIKAPVAIFISFLVFILPVRQSYSRFWDQAYYFDLTYHTPMKLLLQKIARKIVEIRSWGILYIDIGDRMNLETYAALSIPERYAFRVIPHAPTAPGAHRLETYALESYQLSPSEEPLNIWLGEDIAAPLKANEDDPYFQPDLWDRFAAFNGDSLKGWIPSGEYVIEYGPKYLYVRYKEEWGAEPKSFSYRCVMPEAIIKNEKPFILTFWLLSNRWHTLNSLSARLSAFGKIYEWNDIRPIWIDWKNEWRRFSLPQEKAHVSDAAAPLDFMELTIRIDPNPYNNQMNSLIGFKNIQIAKKNSETK